MNKNYSFILVLIVGGAALWTALRFSPSGNIDTAPSPGSPAEMPLPASDGHPPALTPTPQSTPSPDAEVTSFGPHLREIGECLQLSNDLNRDTELKFSALDDSLQNEFGELVANNLDWKNVHVVLPNGEKRRLRMEVEAFGEEATGMRLHYYGVDSEDLPVPLPLTEEQSVNPSEAFIASLESEGKVTLREQAHRGVYSSGAELYYTERNGILSDLEINHQGKSVKCQNLQSVKGSCSCF